MADQDRIAPASPLPWKVAAERSGAVVDARGWGVVEAWIGVGRDDRANARYIAHAANTYPELLSALKGLLSPLDGIDAKRAIDAAIVAVARAEGAEG